jgi:uncharacterized membrane protein
MKNQRKILILLLILGIIDAGYLTVVHFLPSVLACPTIGTTVNCESVLGSSFSVVLGIPLAVLGLIWFVASLLFLLFGFNKIVKNIWMIIGIGGILYSIVGQSLVGKICIYCSALDVLIALSVGMFIYMDNKKKG